MSHYTGSPKSQHLFRPTAQHSQKHRWLILITHYRESGFVCKGCHNQGGQTGWLKQEFIFSQLWRLQVQDQIQVPQLQVQDQIQVPRLQVQDPDVSRLNFFCSLSPWLQMASILPVLPSGHVCVLTSSP